MKARQLVEFVALKMKMSHVYQPLLIKTLVEAGGAATVRHVARAFAAADEAQVECYSQRIRRMPLPVLKRHGVVTVDGDVIRLSGKGLTFEEQAELITACNSRIGEFLANRGQGAWAGLIDAHPVADSVRYEVLVRDRVCQLCGVGRDEAVLEVDHIVPRSKGGSNESSNLQVLCRPCNRGKSNLDDTDLR